MSTTFAVTGDAANGFTSAAAANYYALDSQQDYRIAKTKRISDAMKNPSDYYTKRAAALEGVKTESSKHFGQQYAALIRLNIPHTEAIIRAKALADGMYDLLMANLNIEWPADINALSLQLQSNVARAPTGFVQPNAAVPSGTGGRKRTRKARK